MAMVPGNTRRWLAGAVHLFTALGIVCALMATLALLEHRWEAMFAWLGIALLIDGIDGTFARIARVKEHLPRFSGEQLDLVVDYVTYVFVPALALRQAGYLQGTAGLVLAALVLLSSLYHFSDTESKAPDYSFVGFPAIWNIVAFYIIALAVPPRVAWLIVIVCVVLTFVPWRYVHPLRVRRAFVPTLVLTVLWSIAGLVTLARGFPATGWPSVILIGVALYGLGLVAYAQLRRFPE